MAFTWHGAARAEEVVNLGPLALIQPLLDQLDIAGIIDRHLPPDPQLEFSQGQVLSLLLAARLCQPTALINLPAWGERTSPDILWNLPADKLNDDRLGRALRAFFEHRHSVFASATAQATGSYRLQLALSLDPWPADIPMGPPSKNAQGHQSDSRSSSSGSALRSLRSETRCAGTAYNPNLGRDPCRLV